MLLRRAARFLDPATIWQQLEKQLSTQDADGLAEYHAGDYGPGSLYLGIVRATSERAVWMKTSASQPLMPTDLPAAVWAKQIAYSDHTLLTVVLTDPEEQEAFTSFTHNLLATLEQSTADTCLTTLLATQLRQWQSATSLRLAA